MSDLRRLLFANQTREYTGYPLVISRSVALRYLKQYQMYGNSEQDGAPTPDSPVEVISLGDRTKNLFDCANARLVYMNGSVIYSQTRDYIDVETTVSASNFITLYLCKIEDYIGKTITLSGDVGGIEVLNAISVISSKADGSNRQVVVDKSGASATVTDDGNDILCVRIAVNNKVGKFRISNIQVEVSSTPTSYEPYGYKIPVFAGGGGVVDLGTLNISGNNGIFSFSLPERKTGSTIGGYFDGYTQVSRYADLVSTNKSVYFGSFSDPSVTTTYIHNDAYTDAASFKQAMSGKMLYYQRATDPSWTNPITIPIYLNAPLCKVSDYTDVLDYKKGQIIRNVETLVLDGTEGWQQEGTKYYLNNVFAGLNSIAGSVSTHFTVTNTNTHAADKNIDYGGARPNSMFVRYDAMSTVADFKSWLASQYAAGTPVIIYYPLATPVAESIVAPALPTMAGSTTYTTDTVVKPSNMKGIF